MAGKLIVFEGIDRSGKETQSKILYDRFVGEDFKVKLISFPNYGSDSSLLLRKYLNGDFGQKPDDVNPYAVAMFYALDRFLSLDDWYPFYQQDGIVIFDRYVSSNVVYQASKLTRKVERNHFIDWVTSLEYTRLRAPQATLTLFLDVSPSVSATMGHRDKKDIHEQDTAYLERVYAMYKRMASKRSWATIYCTYGTEIRPVIDISNDVWSLVKQIL